MSENALITTERMPVGWFEEVIPVRGCQLTIENIKEVHKDPLAVNRQFGEQIIATLPRSEEMTDEEWEAKKAFLLNDAFCLTVTVSGMRNQQLYGESGEIFDSPDLPKPIKSIFFTNVNSFKRNASGSNPQNSNSAFIDFRKPELFDPTPFVSEATRNEGKVTINAQDLTFFNAVQMIVEKKLTSHKNWYGAIHRNFVYDFGIWFVALPISLYFSAYYMDRILPVGGSFELFRWPLFFYFIGLSLILFRALVAYAKWAFPVNVLAENNDRTLGHRLAPGGFASWLIYKVASTIYSILIG